ncbi:hypothetical protein LB543_24630 [Mesorhizobium sp. ESP7-2]|nr:hypothetical protein [Mesorhizobium sp. ESP7-2]
MRHDGLVLILLWRELVAGLRAMRRRDLAWIAFGGSGLPAYAVANIVIALDTGAPKLRHDQLLWTVGLPLALAVLGVLAGKAVSELCLQRAFAPFLRALPLAPGSAAIWPAWRRSCSQHRSCCWLPFRPALPAL